MARIDDLLTTHRIKNIQLGMAKNAYIQTLQSSGFIGDHRQASAAFEAWRIASADDGNLQGVQAAVDWTYDQYPGLFAVQQSETQDSGQVVDPIRRREVDHSPRPGISQRAPIGSALRDFLKTTATRAVKLRRGM